MTFLPVQLPSQDWWVWFGLRIILWKFFGRLVGLMESFYRKYFLKMLKSQFSLLQGCGEGWCAWSRNRKGVSCGGFYSFPVIWDHRVHVVIPRRWEFPSMPQGSWNTTLFPVCISVDLLRQDRRTAGAHPTWKGQDGLETRPMWDIVPVLDKL